MGGWVRWLGEKGSAAQVQTQHPGTAMAPRESIGQERKSEGVVVGDFSMVYGGLLDFWIDFS